PIGDCVKVTSAPAVQIHCLTPKRARIVPLNSLITDAYTTVLAPDELVSEIKVKISPKGTGAAYLAFKRAAPVYPTASAAVQVAMDGDVCKEAAIALGCVGLTAIKATAAEAALRGQKLTDKCIVAAAEAARAAADPQPDMRGSVAYKRALVAALVKRAIEIAVR